MIVRSLVTAIAVLSVALAAGGCTMTEPGPTPPPTVVHLIRRLADSGGQIELIRPDQLGPGAVPPERAVEILRRDGGGTAAAYAVRVHLAAGVRPAWLVVRSGFWDPALTGLGGPLDFAIIDALTGEPLDLTVAPAVRPHDVPRVLETPATSLDPSKP